MFKYGNSYKVKWDIIVMLLAAWNTFQIPIDVSFKPESFKSSTMFWVNSFVDLCFFLDILANFRSAYINPKTGEEVRDGK